LGAPCLDFQTWESSESGVSENKNRRSRFIVSPISKSRCGPPNFSGQMWTTRDHGFAV
jgi:hypothetical protein